MPYLTVNQLDEKHKSISKGMVRHYIYCSETNGLDAYCAVARVGGHVIIDENLFLAWLRDEEAMAEEHRRKHRGAFPPKRREDGCVWPILEEDGTEEIEGIADSMMALLDDCATCAERRDPTDSDPDTSLSYDPEA